MTKPNVPTSLAMNMAQGEGRLCRKGAPLEGGHTWCKTPKTRALVKHVERPDDLIEITIMEWSNSGEKVKLRFHADGHTRWIDVTKDKYVLEEVLGNPMVHGYSNPTKVLEERRKRQAGTITTYDLLWALLDLAIKDADDGRVMRSVADQQIIAECWKFFTVPIEARIKAMVEADDGNAGYERCRHMLKAAHAVGTEA